ncbi:nucleotide-binding domain-containing protein [Thelephora ganbajun]|uniref:Nucleotide-binding domain-containing protein n=1 Tax=Thelephora ganbajun TaxID=370292 RepID=A0ACB6ZTA0_THEGA|nr:nucleotide-binding domain-containing protein [Thelephora ganbajun]
MLRTALSRRAVYPALRVGAHRYPSPQVRLASTTSSPRPFLYRTRLCLRWTGYAAASTVLGVTLITGAIFIHDAFTYTDAHVDKVPVSPLALQPETGGPKNLPVVGAFLSDIEDPENERISQKPRLVIVGGGWGAVGLLSKLSLGDYHVTLISPDTFTTFTPLLPSAAVGTVQVRSLIEPLRKIIARLEGHFISGKAVDLVMSERLLEVEVIGPDGSPKSIYVPYDKLVIGVGSVSSTHGVAGLEHCLQLKTIADALQIRRRIMDNFEKASLPTTTPEERRRLLSFVVCGGGPTGVEAAAEIYDLCQEDIMQYYPKICRQEVSIHVIQSGEHILNTYSEAISKYAEDKFARDGVELVTGARVSSVHPNHVVYTEKDKGTGESTEYEIPANFVLWSTGIAMNPFTSKVAGYLPNQVHKKAIEVDSHLRVKGAPLGDVYAIGDCATLETSIVAHLLELVDEADKNKDGKIDLAEWEFMVKSIKRMMPMSEKHLDRVKELFELYDKDKDESLTLNELAVMLQDIGNKITSLPATAQVASQQGKYLGAKLHRLTKRDASLTKNMISREAADEFVSKPFSYHHLGSLAYIGNAAVFDFGKYSFMGGLWAMYAWRSIYFSEQVSSRTKALLMTDWIIRGIWGRDLSRL